MRRVEPEVFLIGETRIDDTELQRYLDFIGTDWKRSIDCSDGESITEVYGRLCYRSFEPGLNANVTKIREGNEKYIGNIINVKHGSVAEHAVTNWIFANISRVFSHELVRHRVGTAFSQESLRYVRLTDLGLWLPEEFEHDPRLKEMFEKVFRDAEELQLELAKYLKLDEAKDFHYKKVMTSAMRRIAPDGLATTIGVSFNFRSLRHIIEMRTNEGAEAEIRLVFDKVAKICKQRYANMFQDFERNEKGEWVTKNSKI